MSVSDNGEDQVCGTAVRPASNELAGPRPTKNRRTSRWLLFGLVVVSFFSMGHFVGAFQKEQEVLRAKAIAAEKFEIRDADKKLRASLFKGTDGGAYLSFFGGKGDPRLTLGVGASGAPIVSFLGDDKSQRISLGIDPDNSAPSIHLFDDKGEPGLSLGFDKGAGSAVTIGKKGKGQISLSVTDRLSSSILITDPNNHPRISLSMSDTEPTILLIGDNGVARASWRVLPSGAVSFSLRDAQSKERLVIMTDQDGKPSIRLLDPEGGIVKEF